MASPVNLINGFLNKAELCARLNLSQRTVENMVRDQRFPPPVQIGKYVYWGESVVVRWQRELLAEQESWFGDRSAPTTRPH